MIRVKFQIKYAVAQGQKLQIVFLNKTASCSNRRVLSLLSLNRNDNEAVLSIPKSVKSLVYRYKLLDDSDNIIIEEPRRLYHSLDLRQDKTEVIVLDYWIEKPKAYYRYTQFFQNLYKASTKKSVYSMIDDKAVFLQLQVNVPRLKADQQVLLLGSIKELGEWRREDALLLSCDESNSWTIKLNLKQELFNQSEKIKYKFAIASCDTDELIWEEGEDRTLEFLESPTEEKDYAITGLSFRLAQDSLPLEKFSGWAVPLFALRSKNDCGIGDFASLKDAVLWTKRANLKVLQLLPINDTTFYQDWRDSYPYNPISVNALNPVYLDLSALPEIESNEFVQFFSSEVKDLREAKQIDYPRVYKLKEDFLNQHIIEQGAKFNLDEIRCFYLEEKTWLKPYVCYAYLRDKEHKGQELEEWVSYDEAISRYGEAIEKFNCQSPFFVYIYTQFLLYRQLEAVVSLTKELNILIKGDIPIGVSPNSVEVWKEPNLFNQEQSAGAPPDYFSEEGQNWSFPTYNWTQMSLDGYAWWQKRVKEMSRFFSAYRIDHILGFFRIWESPREDNSALNGHFSPALPYPLSYWQEKLPNHSIDWLKRIALCQDPYDQSRYHPKISFDKSSEFDTWSEDDRKTWQDITQDYFYTKHNDLWRETACQRLSVVLDSNNMLACAEDLGMIPDSVPTVLDKFELLSLDLERMPKTLSQSQWMSLDQIRYLSVATTSTHDTSNLRLWWRQLSLEDRKMYLSEHLGHSSLEMLDNSQEVYHQIIEKHLNSSAMLVILPFSDWLALDNDLCTLEPEEELINRPEVKNHHWAYRINFDIDEQSKEIELWTNKIAQLVKKYNR